MPAISTTLINSNPQEIPDDIWQDICMEVYNACVGLSPVDTGLFQSSWEMYVHSLDIVEIINPVEYASFLEDGWSKQAPNGIIEPAIRQLPQIIRRYIGHKPRGAVTVEISVPDYVPK